MKWFMITAAVAAMTVSMPANAAATLNGACTTDLTLSAGSSQLGCYGRDDGNVLNNANNISINAALTALGYAGPAITYSALPLSSIISNLGGSKTVDFAGLLNGTVYLGLHFGNGKGGPGETTTFYKLSALNLDTIGLNLNASSNAVLLATVPSVAAVPEPATWAMMRVGFGMMGFAMRSSKRRSDVKFNTKIKLLIAGLRA